MVAFSPSRADGRSDRIVIYDLMRDAVPDQAFSFAEIAAALQAGIAEPIAKSRLYRAVRQGGRTLLQREQRAVQVVKGRGYRIVRANEHMRLTRQRETQARRQMQLGLGYLQHVREDELTPNERLLHRGHLHITMGAILAIEAIHRRQDRQDELIVELLRRTGSAADPKTA